jgi:outer membrane protein OmpA-like peptidoglycan-associated protein
LALNLIKKSYKKNAETKNMINVESHDSISYPVIHFDFDKFSLRDKSVNDLLLLALHLKGISEKIIHVTGHTDNVGTRNYNYVLSLKRANAVKEFLIKQGIRPTQILTDGKGCTEPGSENITPSGRQANRRVEISLSKIK